MESIDGATLRIGRGSSKVSVLFLFSTWCSTCEYTIGELQPLVARAAENVQFIGVGREHEASELKQWRREHEVSFPVVADPSGELYGRFAENYVPRVLVIDEEGRQLASTVGWSAGIAASIEELITADGLALFREATKLPDLAAPESVASREELLYWPALQPVSGSDSDMLGYLVPEQIPEILWTLVRLSFGDELGCAEQMLKGATAIGVSYSKRGVRAFVMPAPAFAESAKCIRSWGQAVAQAEATVDPKAQTIVFEALTTSLEWSESGLLLVSDAFLADGVLSSELTAALREERTPALARVLWGPHESLENSSLRLDVTGRELRASMRFAGKTAASAEEAGQEVRNRLRAQFFGDTSEMDARAKFPVVVEGRVATLSGALPLVQVLEKLTEE